MLQFVWKPLSFSADSRIGFSDGENKIFYLDNAQKLFVSGEYIIAYVGTKHSFGQFVESHIFKIDCRKISNYIVVKKYGVK